MSKLTEYITENCTALDTDELWDQALDEQGDIKIGNLSYNPSRVLKEVDPTAYRCGKNDYIDSLGLKEVDGEEYEARDVDKAADEFKDDLENNINDLEVEIADLNSQIKDTDKNDPAIDGFNTELKQLEAKLAAWQQELDELEEEIKDL